MAKKPTLEERVVACEVVLHVLTELQRAYSAAFISLVDGISVPEATARFNEQFRKALAKLEGEGDEN
jgi:hypothetical protein